MGIVHEFFPVLPPEKENITPLDPEKFAEALQAAFYSSVPVVLPRFEERGENPGQETGHLGPARIWLDLCGQVPFNHDENPPGNVSLP